MTDTEQAAFKSIKSMLGEHFDNFAFVILDEEGDIYHSFKNSIVGKALFAEAVKTMEEEEEFETNYFWEDDDNEGEEWKRES